MGDEALLESVLAGRDLTKLEEHHKAVAFGIVAGLSNADIALEAGLSPGYVSTLKHDPCVLAEVEKLQERRDKARQLRIARLEGMANKALDRQEELLDSKSEKTAVRVAADVLDRAGHPKISRQETQGAHIFVDAAKLLEVEEIVRLAAREGRDIDEIIDARAAEVEPDG